MKWTEYQHGRFKLVNIVTEQDRMKTEQLVRLSSVKPGEGKLVRFQGVSYDDACKGEGQACFYMVVKSPKDRPGYTTLISLDGMNVLERDDCHLVYSHTILEIEISKPHLV